MIFPGGIPVATFGKAKLMKFLEVNIDVFAWSIYVVPGIDPGFICHQLNVNPKAMPHKQPPRQ